MKPASTIHSLVEASLDDLGARPLNTFFQVIDPAHQGRHYRSGSMLICYPGGRRGFSGDPGTAGRSRTAS
ncbi:hypothetical protein LNQ52_30570 [Klebsiella pneumoniae subsp. pneumoniae]|nr:hypothetical protein [Klebsiella pneumoniae subsp. pneumoniae]